MHSIMVIAAFLLFAGAQGARAACPETNGADPRADMKMALDYYSGISESEIIAAADCALRQYEVSQQFEEAYKVEKSTINYSTGGFWAKQPTCSLVLLTVCCKQEATPGSTTTNAAFRSGPLY